MAASGIRCTFVVNDAEYGFSETHVYNGTDFALAKVAALNLFKKRMAICGPPANAFKLRLSSVTTKRSTLLLGRDEIGPINPPAVILTDASGNIGPNNSDQPKSCLQARVRNNTTGQGRNQYIAGIPDPVIRENPEGPSVSLIPSYKSLFDAWVTELTTGEKWGWIARMVAPGEITVYPVVSFGSDVGTGFFQFVLATKPYTAVGTKVFLRGWKMTNKAFLSPEGMWTISQIQDDTPVSGQTQYTLYGTSGINPANVLIPGTVELVDFTFRAYSTVSNLQQNTRKRGNRFLLPPGRRTKRVKV